MKQQNQNMLYISVTITNKGNIQIELIMQKLGFLQEEKKQALIQKSQKFLYQCKKAINKVKTEIKIFFLSLDLKGFYKYHGFNNKGRNYSTDSFSQLRKVDQP